MADQDKNIKVILKKDPAFEGLDFSLLRRLGLEHIGELSGKVWTDHNVHDPGITILEMLIYALMDLGYRTRLPIEDLLAVENPDQQPEDNFFTPAQILTNNPTTILDFRKMLIDIEGVRNAWLEVYQEDKLYVCPATPPVGENAGNDAAIVVTPPPAPVISLAPANGSREVVLNGLYKVLLELDRAFVVKEVEERKRKGKEKEDFLKKQIEEEIVSRARQRLHQHRNLCEDFVDICVLCEEKASFCGDIELYPDARAEEVYVEIIQKIREFLSPSLHFYTLQEMLDQGKSIEEVFEGRPYTLDSHGFVDTAELEQIERKKELHLSDIYSLIFSVRGVKSIRGLKLTSGQPLSSDCDGWAYRLCADCVAVFSAEASTFNLFKGSMAVRLDKTETEKLLERRLSEFRKVKLRAPELLDRLIPQGRYRKTLEDYYSIQNEFPRTYGIGEGGLPPSAPVLRQAQALQLKGYLLFFDQLLASYLSQLANIRNLFSMWPDSRRAGFSRHTYFTQRLDSVPEVKRLVRFYSEEQGFLRWQNNSILAQPVERDALDNLMAGWRQNPSAAELAYGPHHFDTPFKRDAALEQLRQEFQQAEFLLEVFGSKCAYFFVIITSSQDVGLVSKKYYDTEDLAWEAGRSTAFLGSLENSYQHVNKPNDTGTVYAYSFNLAFTPVSYLSFLQQIMEDEQIYQSRRDDFLNHLLARFGEAFTDFTLLMYKKLGLENNGRQRLLEDKARYLSQYDELSRNRGKAYDYCLNGWDTGNVSGLEKRVAGLVGIQDFKRQYLCNFEIVEYGEELALQLRGPEGDVLLQSAERFDSRTYAETALASLIDGLRAGDGLKAEHVVSEGKYRLYLHTDKMEAASPGLFISREMASEKIQVLKALFNPKKFGGGVYVSQYKSHLVLKDQDGAAVRRSRRQFDSETSVGQKDREEFARNVNNQLKVTEAAPTVSLKKSPLEPGVYFDLQALAAYRAIGPPRYKWAWLGKGGEPILQSLPSFSEPLLALAHFSGLISPAGEPLRFEDQDEDATFTFSVRWPSGETVAQGVFATRELRDNARQETETYFEQETSGGYFLTPAPESFGWELWKDQELLLESALLGPSSNKAKVAWQYASALSANLKIMPAAANSGLVIELRNQDGILLAHSPILPDEKRAAELLKATLASLGDEKQIRFPKHGQAYGYRIPDFNDASRAFLASYFLYDRPSSALQALESHLAHARKAGQYNLSGDAGRFSLSFELKDKDGQYIAEHPGMYGSPEERLAIRDQGVARLKKFKFPLQYQQKYRYGFTSEDGSTLLESSREFDSEKEAANAYLEMLPLAAYSPNFAVRQPENSIGQYLEVRDGNDLLAAAPRPFPAGQGIRQTQAKVMNLIKSHSYSVGIADYPYRWKYRLLWEGPAQKLEPLLDSLSDFDSETGARDVFNRLVDNLNTVTAAPADGPAIQFLFKGETAPFAGHPAPPFDSEAERESARQRAERWMQYSGQVSWVGATLPAAAGPAVTRAPESADGRFAYRVLKKGQPLAFHPCQCYSKKDRLALQEAINCLYGERNHYEYPEFCLDGDAICEMNGRYYYQLRDKKKNGPVYFISFEGYAGREEALAALRGSYLEIIHLAIDPESYQERRIRKSVYPPLISLKAEYADPQVRYPAGLAPVVVVPPETAAAFGLTQSDAGAFTTLFCKYPIQLVKPSCSTDPCKGEQNFFYYFHLVGDGHCQSGDCKVDWQSSRVYDNPEAAIRDFQLFLHLLKAKANYRPHLDETGYFDCWSRLIIPDEQSLRQNGACQSCRKDEEEYKPRARCCYYISLAEVLVESTQRFKLKENAWGRPGLLAVHPGRAFSLEEACRAIEGFCNCFRYQNEFPFLPAYEERVNLCGEILWYFVLNEATGAEVIFESYTGYNSESDAEKAARQLWDHIRQCRNFVVIRNGDCDYRIAVTNVNLQDCPVEEDWARVIACGRRKFKNLEEACDAHKQIAPYFEFNNVPIRIQVETEWIQDDNPDETRECLKTTVQFYQRVAASNEEELAKELIFVSNRLYTEEEKDWAVRQAQQSTLQLLNYKIVSDPDCYYCLGLVGPTIDDIPLSRVVTHLEVSNGVPCPVLEGRGLEYLIGASCEEGAFYPYIRGDEERCFSFRIVDRNYRLARHPFDYHTTKGAREAMRWLRGNCSCETLPDLKISREEGANLFSVIVQVDSDGPAFRLSGFDNMNAEDAGKGFLQFVSMAQHRIDPETQEPLCPNRPAVFSTQDMQEFETRYQTLLGDFREHGQTEAGLKQFICRFPLYKDGETYGFQVYCEGFLRSKLPYIAKDFDDSEPCAGCDGGKPAGSSEQTGAFVWLSAQTYASFEEALCHYHTFCRLLADQAHYQATDVLGCGPYSIELVNPDEALAEHPQCYNFVSDLKEAMARTMSCIHEEGFHFVEHILLRPHKYAERKEVAGVGSTAYEVFYPYTCLLPADPDCDCLLYYDFAEDDPCSKVGEEQDNDCPQEQSGECEEGCYIPGADPYSFWATVVLPCWPKRFRDHNFREFFQELIRRETPAHIGLNILWVSPWQFCRFEEQYRQWLRFTSGRYTCGSDDVFCSFVECLSALNCCPPEYKEEDAVPSCESDNEKAAGNRLFLNISNFFIRNLFSSGSHPALSTIWQSSAYSISGNLATTSQAIALPPKRFGRSQAGAAPGRVNLPQCEDYGDGYAAIAARGRFIESAAQEATEKAAAPEPPKTRPKAEKPATPKPKKKAQETTARKGAKTEAEKPAEPLFPREVAQRIRQRQTQYSTALEGLDNRYFKQTNAFRRVEFFIGQTDGNIQAFAELIRFVIDDQRERNKPEYRPYYQEILKTACWYCLDKLVLSDPEKVQEPETLKQLLSAMKKQGLSLAAIRKEWQGEALQEWTGAAVVEDYKKMLK